MHTLRNISITSIGNFINASMGFVFIAGLADSLSLSEFGKYALLNSIFMLFTKVTDFGTNSVYVSHQRKYDHTTILVAKFILLVTLLPIALVAIALLGFTHAAFHIIFAFGALGYLFNDYLQAIFQSQMKFVHLVALNTFPAIAKLIVGVLLLSNTVSLNLTQAFGIFCASIYLSLLFLGELISSLQEQKGILGSLRSSTDEFIKKSVPAGFSLVVTESIPAIVNTVTKILTDYSNVGLIALLSKISQVFSIVALSFFSVLLPNEFINKNKYNRFSFKEIWYLSAFMIFASTAIIFLLTQTIPFILEGKFASSMRLISIVVLTGTSSTINTLLESYFYIEDKLKLLGKVSLIKLGLFLTLLGTLGNAIEDTVVGITLSGLVTNLLSLCILVVLILRSRQSFLNKLFGLFK